jgi:hypothetical protein
LVFSNLLAERFVRPARGRCSASTPATTRSHSPTNSPTWPPTSWSPIRDDRVFYTDPTPTPTGALGRPRRHGDRFGLADPNTWPTPDVESTTTDVRYGTVKVSACHGLHPKLGRRGHWADHDESPIVAGTVIRVDVQHLPKPTSATKKTLWL